VQETFWEDLPTNLLDRASHITKKECNFRRPVYAFDPDSNTVTLHVIPGRDYVRHYVSLIFNVVPSLCTSNRTSIVVYPLAEAFLPEYTGLEQIVGESDVVVIGMVEKMAAFMAIEHPVVRFRKDAGNGNYSAWKASHRGKTVTLLCVVNSFWGDMAAIISMALCRLGVMCILYVSKVGSLTHPSDCYRAIYCPDQFLIMNGTCTEVQRFAPDNMLTMHPTGHLFIEQGKKSGRLVREELANALISDEVSLSGTDSNKEFPVIRGTHVSIPTVVEESLDQASIARSNGALTIDDESAKIAFAIQLENAARNKLVKYFAVHYTTDYLRDGQEIKNNLHTICDLSISRAGDGAEHIGIMKKHVLRQAFQLTWGCIEDFLSRGRASPTLHRSRSPRGR